MQEGQNYLFRCVSQQLMAWNGAFLLRDTVIFAMRMLRACAAGTGCMWSRPWKLQPSRTWWVTWKSFSLLPDKIHSLLEGSEKSCSFQGQIDDFILNALMSAGCLLTEAQPVMFPGCKSQHDLLVSLQLTPLPTTSKGWCVSHTLCGLEQADLYFYLLMLYCSLRGIEHHPVKQLSTCIFTVGSSTGEVIAVHLTGAAFCVVCVC